MIKLFKTPEQYLEFYFNKYKYNFRTQHWSTKPTQWLDYGTEDFNIALKHYKYVNHREIFPDEIVFDLDLHGDVPSSIAKERAIKLGRILAERLKQKGFSFTFWESGGSGTHIHLFFPELLQYKGYQKTAMRKLFYRYIGKEFIKTEETEAHICHGNPSLIQLEMAIHRKGGKKTLIEWYDTNKENIFPLDLLNEFNNKKTESIISKPIVLTPGTPKAIQILENEEFSNIRDGRRRALFVLSCYYSKFMPQEQLFEKLSKWNKEKLNGHLHPQEISATVKQRYKTDNSKRPLFPFHYLRDLLEEIGVQCDYSDIVFQNRKV